ncbi:MAG: prepilin-type N-terminal cleavage/methylation domain-containing protein [Magnetococcales bacterium]|nr:prepilin-type N-terminal cleavage/methylation domain-containing protein [Magnetococcales bacterium]
MKKQNDKQQSGFSLIEIAIVLVIIGLLIGGVLKGQAMVKNSKIKRIATDTAAVQGALNAYMDSYWVLPGDDANSATRWAIAAPATQVAATRGNGLIEGFFNDPAGAKVVDAAATVETTHAWNHLYCEGLIKGVCTATAGATIAPPTNPIGGITGVADGRVTANRHLGLTKKMVCMRGIPSEYAMVYDTQFDDGAGLTGDVRGSAAADDGTAVGTATTYDITNAQIIICTGF